MTVNVLSGYLIVEINCVLAHYLGLTSMGYRDILILSIIVDGGTLICILILARIEKLSRVSFLLFFAAELLLFISTFSIVVYKLQEIRTLALVYSMVAIMILLPLSSYKESLLISLSSITVYIASSYFAIYYGGQHGVFIKELYYTISFIPILIITSYVAYQISTQRKTIQTDQKLLREMNDALRKTNMDLERTNTIARNEMELAANVQGLILPPAPANVENWDIALRFKPMFGASGDFYDFYVKDGQLQGISLFDVSGHGISSALVTMIVKPITFRKFTGMRGESLDAVVRQVDEQVSREMVRLDNYMSCVMLRCNGDRVEYVNAGHPDILRRKNNGDVSIIEAEGRKFRGIPIGLNIVHKAPEAITFNIENGDALLLYSDGILYSKNPRNEMYGAARLASSLKDAPGGTAEAMLDFIVQRFYSFSEGVEMNDDFTLILIKRTA